MLSTYATVYEQAARDDKPSAHQSQMQLRHAYVHPESQHGILTSSPLLSPLYLHPFEA